MSNAEFPAVASGSNAFLEALSPRTRAACIEHSTARALSAGDIVGHKGEPYAEIHFPLTGMISEVEEGRDGGSAEVTIVGYEGCSGVEALLGMERQPFLRCVEVPTLAVAVPVDAMRAIVASAPDLQRLTNAYAAARLRGSGISIGCYARHPVNARLARWLLRVHDRVRGDSFDLTHETIALMLGVRRSSVTRAMLALAEADAIEGARNRVRIRNRDRLERLACSCYPDGREVFAGLYHSDARNEIT